MEPYRYTGKHNSGPMRIEAHDHEEGLAAVVVQGAKPVYVDALDIPEVTNAMHRAAGQEPPVMLGRPDLASARDGNGWIGFRGLQLRKSDDGGVTFSVGGNTETLTEAQARQCAAVVVALADGPPEPDPAEVDEIAALIYAGLYPGYAEPPGERARDAARAVLLRLRDRGPRDA